MRRIGSLVMRAADATRVPAGAALAVDRERFAETITAAIETHPRITLQRIEVDAIPGTRAADQPVIIATGPLTSDRLSADIAAFAGAEHLSFYDAISPIVLAESIDTSRVFRASRWNRSLAPVQVERGQGSEPGAEDQAGDYLNCPMSETEYGAFHAALTQAESASVHDFDREIVLRGLSANRSAGPPGAGYAALRADETGRPRRSADRAAAVRRRPARQDNLAGDHLSLVGFQTQLKWGDQERVLRMIPGLERAEFVRLGMVHRNTYLNGPAVLRDTWQTRRSADLFFAGQISGVEGYVESASSGLLAGINAAALCSGRDPRPAPRSTAIGALAYYVSHAAAGNFQPTNITFGIMEPLSAPPRNTQARRRAMAERALRELAAWSGTA